MMSAAGDLSVDRNGAQPYERALQLLKENAVRALAKREPAERGETYESVEEYDPVLRAHCRL